MGIIRKQGLNNSIVTYIGIAIGFVSLIFLQPLFLTTEELGLTRILISVSYVISTIIPLGIANGIIKFFPQFKDPQKHNHGFLGIMLLFLMVGILFSGSLLYSFKSYIYIQYQKESPLFMEYFNWIFPFSIFMAFISVLNIYCYSLYKTFFASLLNDILVRIFSTILFSVYFLKLISLKCMITLFIGIYGMQVIALIVYIVKNDAFNLNIDFDFLRKSNYKEMIHFIIFFSIAPIASSGIKFFDSIIIGKFLPLSMVGIYAVMTFIPSFIEAPLIAIEKIANAKISDAITRNDQQDLKDIYYKSCRFLMAIAGLLLILIYTNAGYLLSFMKPEYLKGLNVIYIISLSATFNLYTGTNNALLFYSNKYVFGVLLLVGVLIVTLCLNIALIPIWGINGAAIATTTAGLFLNLVKFVFIRMKYNLQPYDIRNFKIILITIVSLSLLFVLPEVINIYVSAIYKTVFLSALYLGMIYVTKSVVISEISK